MCSRSFGVVGLSPIAWIFFGQIVGIAALVVVFLCLGTVFFILRGTRGYAGFHEDEAANFVWANLLGNERHRLALGHIGAAVGALGRVAREDDLPADDDALALRLHQVLAEEGVSFDFADIRRVIALHYQYLAEKDLL